MHPAEPGACLVPWITIASCAARNKTNSTDFLCGLQSFPSTLQLSVNKTKDFADVVVSHSAMTTRRGVSVREYERMLLSGEDIDVQIRSTSTVER